jgi:hypothetical protein
MSAAQRSFQAPITVPRAVSALAQFQRVNTISSTYVSTYVFIFNKSNSKVLIFFIKQSRCSPADGLGHLLLKTIVLYFINGG